MHKRGIGNAGLPARLKAVLRQFQPRDFDRLLAMYELFAPKGEFQGLPPLTHPQTAAWLRHVCDIGSAQFIIEIGRDLVGHSMLCSGPRQNEAELAVFLLQDLHSLGLGKLLTLGTLRHGCKELKLDRVWLSVQGTNSRALRFFEDIGFRPAKEWDPFTWELEMERPSHCAQCKADQCILFAMTFPRTFEVLGRQAVDCVKPRSI
jgi:RimJ/RimL family protein N-acetyltransferase